MEYLDWDRLGKTFYLLDTFAGIDPRYVSAVERETELARRRHAYLRRLPEGTL